MLARIHLHMHVRICRQSYEVDLPTSMHDGGVQVGEPMRDLNRNMKNLCNPIEAAQIRGWIKCSYLARSRRGMLASTKFVRY
jgi:hypothetical protein